MDQQRRTEYPSTRQGPFIFHRRQTGKAGYSGAVMHLHWLTHMALLSPACSLSYAHIFDHARAKPIRVISAAREVVSRVISGALQYLDTMRTSSGSLDVERAVAHLEDTFLHDCDVITGWIDYQFFFHLDIYAPIRH